MKQNMRNNMNNLTSITEGVQIVRPETYVFNSIYF